MTDSVQNLLWSLRLKSENTEDAPEPLILRVRVPGVDSAASGDGTCRIERIRGRENSMPSGTSDMIGSKQWIGGFWDEIRLPAGAAGVGAEARG